MKRALISPVEIREDLDGNQGYRVAFVDEVEFDVAPPLFWVDCPDECVQDVWVYVDGSFKDTTPPKVEIVDETVPPIQNLVIL